MSNEGTPAGVERVLLASREITLSSAVAELSKRGLDRVAASFWTLVSKSVCDQKSGIEVALYTEVGEDGSVNIVPHVKFPAKVEDEPLAGATDEYASTYNMYHAGGRADCVSLRNKSDKMGCEPQIEETLRKLSSSPGTTAPRYPAISLAMALCDSMEPHGKIYKHLPPKEPGTSWSFPEPMRNYVDRIERYGVQPLCLSTLRALHAYTEKQASESERDFGKASNVSTQLTAALRDVGRHHAAAEHSQVDALKRLYDTPGHLDPHTVGNIMKGIHDRSAASQQAAEVSRAAFEKSFKAATDTDRAATKADPQYKSLQHFLSSVQQDEGSAV